MAEPKAYLLDIFNSITPPEHLKRLREYFVNEGARFIRAHLKDPPIVELIKRRHGLSGVEDIVRHFDQNFREMRTDRNYMTLLSLFAMEVYLTERYEPTFYDDVPRAFMRWKNGSQGIYTYANASVYMQRVMFLRAKMVLPDETRIFDAVNGFFSRIGHGRKDDPQSYRKIAAELHLRPLQITYVDDQLRTLEAAATAGLRVALISRSEATRVARHPYQSIRSLDELS